MTIYSFNFAYDFSDKDFVADKLLSDFYCNKVWKVFSSLKFRRNLDIYDEMRISSRFFFGYVKSNKFYYYFCRIQ